MRNILATIIGFLVASITVFIIETPIGHSLFPLPEGAKPMDMEWLKNNLDKIPVGAKICVAIAHAAGILLGMYIAVLISKKSVIPSYIVAGIMIFATVTNIIFLPKSLWFITLDVLLVTLGAYAGYKLVRGHLN